MKLTKRIIGAFLFILGVIILISSQSGITGNVIGEGAGGVGSILGIVLVIGGLVLMEVVPEYREERVPERNYAQEAIETRKGEYKARELLKIAREMGYTLDRGKKEGTKILNGEIILTVIPNHKVIGRTLARSILEDLASGESSFRRRTT